MRFRPTEVLFSPTADCNLSCPHCITPKSSARLPAKTAGSFLLQCKRAGIRKVSFTGGEPFLDPGFLVFMTKLAVREGMLFGRIITNGVWYKDAAELKSVLGRLFDAGYDGDICVSVDAFHRQSLAKLAAFIDTAVAVWRRPDVVSLVWVGGARERESAGKLRGLVHRSARAFLRMVRIELSPIGKAGRLKAPWGRRWFKEDYCRGPGNVLMVEPNGDVKPCCGYASDLKGLTIGNIKKDTAKKMIANCNRKGFPGSIFRIGLSGIRRRLQKLGVDFPGKAGSHCFFCHYILTKVPGKTLNKALIAALSVFLIVSNASAEPIVLKKAKGYRGIKAKVVERITLPRWYHEGLFFDGDSIIVANGRGGNIWTVDLVSKKVSSEIVSPAGFTESVARIRGGGYLVTDWDDKKLYEARLADGKMVIEKVLFDFAPAHPAGLVIAGERILAVTWTRGLGTKFEIMELDKDFKEVSRVLVNGIQEPAHMAWDGKGLWITSWFDRRVYRTDPDKWEITASFRAPFGKVTGIAWDGKYLWLTGTYADLYKLRFSTPGVD